MKLRFYSHSLISNVASVICTWQDRQHSTATRLFEREEYFFWLNPLKFAILLRHYFFCIEKYLNSLINRLEHDSLLAIEWFENNYMKLNQKKMSFSSIGEQT